jgi:hypothetical protein
LRGRDRSGFAVTPGIWTERLPDSITTKHYSSWSVIAQSAWNKPAASIVAACARRTGRQVASVRRFGAGVSSAP